MSSTAPSCRRSTSPRGHRPHERNRPRRSLARSRVRRRRRVLGQCRRPAATPKPATTCDPSASLPQRAACVRPADNDPFRSLPVPAVPRRARHRQGNQPVPHRQPDDSRDHRRRAVPRRLALVTLPSRQCPGGSRASPACRREARTQEFFTDVNGRYRDPNIWSNRLASTFGPAINLLGRLTTALVLLFGGYLLVQGQLTRGLLTAFVLYLGHFFPHTPGRWRFHTRFRPARPPLANPTGAIPLNPPDPTPHQP